ncbi:MAG: hypothetical protein WBG65_00605 [Sulfurimonadaceae bacterium]
MKKILVTLTLLSSLAFANPFGAGNKSVGVTLGSGSVSYSSGTFFGSYTENYYILGVSADYFVLENLALGLGYRGWFGGSPTIHQGTVPVTYYIPTSSKFRPYLGAFYRYTYINDDRFDNYSSAGGRAGLAILFQNGYVGLGWVQEYYLDSDSRSDTTSGYPEVVIGFTF